MFDLVTLATTYHDQHMVTASLPSSFLTSSGRHRITLRNALGESAPIDFTVTEKTTVPPVLQQLTPDSIRADTPIEGRADGSLLLQVTADELTRNTVVLWDGITLATTAHDDRTLSAQVPAQFLADPGRHAVTLRSGLGDSNALEFVVAPKTTNPPRLISVQPTVVEEGTTFSPRLDGRSTLRIEAAEVTRDTVVTFDGIALPTEQEDGRTLIASVPPEFLTRPGQHAIGLRNAQGASATVDFVVTPKPASAPVLLSLQPTRTLINAPFNPGPDGTSALVITTEHAAAGTAVMFDDTTLPTSVESERLVRASVPQEFLSQAARHRITLRNVNGRSNSIDFVVEP